MLSRGRWPFAENEAEARQAQAAVDGVTVGARNAGGAVGDAQTGYLRSYALAIALGVAILVVVFASVQ